VDWYRSAAFHRAWVNQNQNIPQAELNPIRVLSFSIVCG
jgi:hypothetical protein